MRARWRRIEKVGSSAVLALVLLTGAVGCAGLEMVIAVKPWKIEKCGWPCLHEIIVAGNETPTVEASLERVNTAARLVELGELMLQGLPLSAGSLWPQEMRGTLTLNAQSFNRILQENYSQRTLYAAGLGFQPSPWTGRALELQQRLFTTPPDLHHEPTYRPKAPSAEDVQVLAEKVLGKGYDRVFDKTFFRLILVHPDFIPKREIFTAQFEGKPADVYPNVMDAVLALADNREDLLQFREAVLQGEETCERAYRDVEESVQRIRDLKDRTFGNPATAEEAAKKGDENASSKDLQELEGQYETEKKEYEDAVNAYQVSLQQLGVAVGQIRHQSSAFTVEQRALAINVQAVVDSAQTLLSGTRQLTAIAAVHVPKAILNVRGELQRIASMGGNSAVERMKRIVVNGSLLKPNLSLLASESSVLEAESKPYDELFEKRINAPTVAAP
ncbi:MAG: hypothetical protein KAY09_00385 [Nitrospira sp.]|nr:hypothetical protein [Nitrospira sp.]